MEISKHDGESYRYKMPGWQENYMEHLCKEAKSSEELQERVRFFIER